MCIAFNLVSASQDFNWTNSISDEFELDQAQQSLEQLLQSTISAFDVAAMSEAAEAIATSSSTAESRHLVSCNAHDTGIEKGGDGECKGDAKDKNNKGNKGNKGDKGDKESKDVADDEKEADQQTDGEMTDGNVSDGE